MRASSVANTCFDPSSLQDVDVPGYSLISPQCVASPNLAPFVKQPLDKHTLYLASH